MSPELSPAFKLEALQQEFGSVLGRHLSREGVTPEQLTQATGKKKGSLNKWNRGESLPALDTFNSILGLLDLPEEKSEELKAKWKEINSLKLTLRRTKRD